jgi:protein TilB
MNFVDIENLKESMENLKKNIKLRDLYLTGNPCEQWSGCKNYVIAHLPFLFFLNGSEILKSERIKAAQELPFLEEELKRASIENIIKKETDPDKDNPNKYTIEYRRKLYKEIEEEKEQKEKAKSKNQKSPWDPEEHKGPHPIYKDNGEIRVCNQGKYEFVFDEDIYVSGITVFELKVPKHMQTSQIQVDLTPQYVRCVVKDKATQIKFGYEIITEKSLIQRSTTTGDLIVKCPILGYEKKYTGIDLASYNFRTYREWKKKQNETSRKKLNEKEQLEMDNLIKEKEKKNQGKYLF